MPRPRCLRVAATGRLQGQRVVVVVVRAHLLVSELVWSLQKFASQEQQGVLPHHTATWAAFAQRL